VITGRIDEVVYGEGAWTEERPNAFVSPFRFARRRTAVRGALRRDSARALS